MMNIPRADRGFPRPMCLEGTWLGLENFSVKHHDDDFSEDKEIKGSGDV
jgi:hypothetical protein